MAVKLLQWRSKTETTLMPLKCGTGGRCEYHGQPGKQTIPSTRSGDKKLCL